MHPADVKSTQANIGKAQSLGYAPTTTIQEGIKHFADWFKRVPQRYVLLNILCYNILNEKTIIINRIWRSRPSCI